jgi:hypothetical protein
MPLCWKCNTRVRYVSDGWFCPCCSQHGPPDRIEENWEDAMVANCPYRGGNIREHQSSGVGQGPSGQDERR